MHDNRGPFLQQHDINLPGNTWKEDAAVEYTQTFNRMFCNRYPHRRPLFLTAKNEAGVPKLVSDC